MAKSVAAPKKSNAKPSKKAASPVKVNMAAVADLSAAEGSDEAAIAALLSELGAEEVGQGDVALASDEVVITSVVGEIEEAEEIVGDVRAGEIDPDHPAAEIERLLSEQGEEAPAVEGAATEAPKKERVPRKHYTNRADRIKDRLGESLVEFTVLTTDDVAVATDDAALKAKMEETMLLIRGMSSKKQNRASFLMEFVSGKKATLNEVMERALKVLHADGKITTGKDGNLLTNLLARPYSPAAARAMGGNTVAVLEDLKLISPAGKGEFVANPNSLLLAKANSLLGLV